MADDRSVEQALSVADDDGRVIVRVALALTLYLRDAHLPASRRAVAGCLADFGAMVGDRIRWASHPTTHDWQPADGRSLRAIEPWLLQVDPMAGWTFYVHGGNDPEEASDIRVSGMGLPSWTPQGLSYLKFVLPLTWFADHPGSMPEFALQICQRLRPVSGYGGLGFVESPSTSLHHLSDPMIFQLAQRFVGIDVDAPVSHSLYLGERIKGVNWLTVLGEPLLDKLGGRERLREQLLPPARLLDFDGGAIVQAGRRPQFGDREAGRGAPEYEAVNRLLKPLRIASMVLQKGGRGPRFDKAASDAWLARFD